MVALALVALAALLIVAIVSIALQRPRHAPAVRVTPRSIARRQPHLEDAIRPAFDGPSEKHGRLFVSYAVWKRDQETRLELIAADPFARLNEFTRSLIVRHLWRALEKVSAGSVVVVDDPPQRWSESIDVSFRDQGIDPWRIPRLVAAPQFVKD
jgi:hypothetical protein